MTVMPVMIMVKGHVHLSWPSLIERVVNTMKLVLVRRCQLFGLTGQRYGTIRSGRY
jgi:hypothetical protein